MAEGVGDHILLLRLWEEWEASHFSRDVAKELGLDSRGMGFARDIRRQLEGEGTDPVHTLQCLLVPLPLVAEPAHRAASHWYASAAPHTTPGPHSWLRSAPRRMVT